MDSKGPIMGEQNAFLPTDFGCLVDCDSVDRDPLGASESRLRRAGFLLLVATTFFGVAALSLILIFGARFLRIFFQGA